MAAIHSSFKCIYLGLWLIRTCFALLGTGYIHPDEYMQNGEITAGDIFSFHVLRTWEWQDPFPVRSVVPPFLTTGTFVKILSTLPLFEKPLPPLTIFRSERFTFLLLSALLDVSLWQIVSAPKCRQLALILLASSHVIHTFQIRPFSNSLESVLVALCLLLLRRISTEALVHLQPDGKIRTLHLLAILFVIGIFTRPTFVVFALPIGYQVLIWSRRVAGSPIQAVKLLLAPLCTAALTASGFILADTYYFHSDLCNLVITPYNFLKYNLVANNLADHGLHPRWLHALVNLPILVGPWVLCLALCSIYESIKRHGHGSERGVSDTDVIGQTTVQMIIVSLSILSVQPHQEPRFLIPLVLPITILVATSKQSSRLGKAFWVTWTMFNVSSAVVFGFMHQGGVIPSLFYLNSMLAENATRRVNIIYWKTYMPPRHLLAVSQREVESGKVVLTDLAGSPQEKLIAALLSPNFDVTYLASPMAVYLTVPGEVSSCLTQQTRIFPHLDLDHIPEIVQAGWHDGLSLGIYAVDRSCVLDTVS
ncbi:glycosyltransferase family 22 protein [Phlebopus sp. FC_14]|nr:glycosyltransferase family 22 protein [Phlebopus sp. FC_14]